MLSVAQSAPYLGGGGVGLRGLLPGGGGSNPRTGSVDFDNFAVVPEPSSWALMLVGAIGLLALRRRAGKAA